MLAEGRSAAILSILQKQKAVTVLELTQTLSISGSTIWRDLVALHRIGKLKEIHGGATLLHKEYGLYETEVAARSEEHVEERKRIACCAASLIQAHNFVYIDTGSATLHMVEYSKEEGAVYVTSGPEHERRLAMQGSRIFLLAGELKSKTEAMVGLGAAFSLQKYDFNKAFSGTNGITVDSSFTTPNVNEAYVRTEAMKHAQRCYMFADSGEFGTCTSITATGISDTTIITGKGVEKEHLEGTDIIEVEE